MEIPDMIKEFNGQLVEQKATIVELEKQLKVVDQDILTFRGAILACNELIEENEPKSNEPEIVDLDKEKDGG